MAQAGPSHPLHAFFPAMDEGVAERGSAVLELFQRAHAPASIDLSALNERPGAPACGMEIDEATCGPSSSGSLGKALEHPWPGPFKVNDSFGFGQLNIACARRALKGPGYAYKAG